MEFERLKFTKMFAARALLASAATMSDVLGPVLFLIDHSGHHLL